MSDYVRKLGEVEDNDGVMAGVGIDYNCVVIYRGAWEGIRLNQQQAEEFGRLFIAACWEAGKNDERDRHEQEERARD